MPIVNNFPPASSSGIFPGMILMWSGTIDTIPGGWQLCDGTNGTPNLVDRFIVGAGSSYDVGGTGGSASVALTTAQMPSHTHSGNISLSNGGAHQHRVYFQEGTTPSSSKYHDVFRVTAEYCEVGTYYNLSSDDYDGYVMTDDAQDTGTHSHTGTATIGSTGSGSSHENRPPYYALAYIMKL